MAKEKDPAFLFYSKDWLQGTAGLMPDEKGVYVDLLAHQHQNGDLPNDVKRLARMVGLSQPEFDAIWTNISNKFISTTDNRLVNRKLIKIVTERSTKAHTKAILSRYAVLVRGLKSYPSSIVDKIKKGFKVSDFEPFEILEATERLDAWFSERLTTVLAIGTATVLEDENKEGGMGEGAAPTTNHLGVVVYDAEKEILANPIRFEQLCMNTGKDPTTGKEILRKYHLYLTEKEQYPKGKNAVYAGFEKWLMNEKNAVNGAHQQSTSNSAGAKPGTSQARINTAKKW